MLLIEIRMLSSSSWTWSTYDLPVWKISEKKSKLFSLHFLNFQTCRLAVRKTTVILFICVQPFLAFARMDVKLVSSKEAVEHEESCHANFEKLKFAKCKCEIIGIEPGTGIFVLSSRPRFEIWEPERNSSTRNSNRRLTKQPNSRKIPRTDLRNREIFLWKFQASEKHILRFIIKAELQNLRNFSWAELTKI